MHVYKGWKLGFDRWEENGGGVKLELMGRVLWIERLLNFEFERGMDVVEFGKPRLWGKLGALGDERRREWIEDGNGGGKMCAQGNRRKLGARRCVLGKNDWWKLREEK
ncbi:unnamed protein product [Calypogeia fissa]